MEMVRRNVNEAFYDVMSYVLQFGVEEESRNGRVLTLQEPFILRYTNPNERVLFHPNRKNDPFLDFFDSILTWGPDGSSSYFEEFSTRFKSFANEGVLLGHYGARTQSSIPLAIERLRSNHVDRRVCIPIYNTTDLMKTDDVKDVPCNVMILPRIVNRDGDDMLDFMVVNRSNDVAWGLLGANALQFSILQELMATTIDVEIGHLTHVTNNLHGYLDFGPFEKFEANTAIFSPHMYVFHTPAKLNMTWEDFTTDLEEMRHIISHIRSQENEEFYNIDPELIISGTIDGYNFSTYYFDRVVMMVWLLHHMVKYGDRKKVTRDTLGRQADRIECPEWRRRFNYWIIQEWKP